MTSARTSPASRSILGCLALAGLLAGVAPSRAADAPDSTGTPPFPPPATRAWQTGLARTDRLQHASLSFTIGVGVGAASRDPVAAFAAPAAIGLVKEIADRHGSGFDVTDLIADLIGAGAAAWVASRWEP